MKCKALRKAKRQMGLDGNATCRIFSEKTGVCGTPNLERKRGVSELRKAESTAVMTGSDRWTAAIGIL